ALSVTGNLPSSERIREFGQELGPAAPFMWPFLFGVVNFLVPWPILAGATGLLFGTAAGTGLALLGVLVAAALQFGAARVIAGEDFRRRVLRRAPRFDQLLRRNGLLAIFLSRIVPGLPWGMVNYAAGLARVGLPVLWLATVIGGTPKVFAYVALGGNFDDLSAPEAKAAIAVMVVMALAGLVLLRRQLARARSPEPPPTLQG
ncbi:MAG: TVP38/TMEM64 family protein, partial [Thermoleophilaceae bacterium]|nr:TVP38/TMEM64 family protein [Thermoleophilaceae bacterium]